MGLEDASFPFLLGFWPILFSGVNYELLVSGMVPPLKWVGVFGGLTTNVWTESGFLIFLIGKYNVVSLDEYPSVN